ncbi:MAG: Pyrimidine-specific ribonucleoside hydrolase RihA [Candidatus Erwinia impunctatus]|nr:Pyrimidine-specific ribonucleoside hydrolase RihA [Culicoides impunctatus]
MSEKRKIIIDTDPAIGISGTDADDPIAIMLALRDPRLQLMAITTVFGNCPPTLGARCATRILQVAGRTDIPVAIGMATPLSGELPEQLQQAYAGARGREGCVPLPPEAQSHCGIHASELIIDLVRKNPGEITIVCFGSQSNLALAMLKAPDIIPLIKNVVMMAGALGLNARWGRGNITPVAECNIWFDPPAAARVFRSGIPLSVVSLDVTNADCGLVLTKEDLQGLDGKGEFIGLLKTVCSTYFDAPMFEWSEECVLYDPLAVAVAANAEIGKYQPMAIGIETTGTLTTGQTVPLRDTVANVNVYTDIDGRQIVQDIIKTIITPVS